MTDEIHASETTDGRAAVPTSRDVKLGNSIFLSYPKPYNRPQEDFVQNVSDHLVKHGLLPRTLGVTDYDLDAPLNAVRRLMLESNGLIAIAFRRVYVKDGVGNHRTDVDRIKEYPVQDEWLTSPWAHIEPAMAFQLGLPILIMRESGVRPDGILEKGVTGLYAPEFELEPNGSDYLSTHEFAQILSKWTHQVQTVVDRKGRPPRLYD